MNSPPPGLLLSLSIKVKAWTLNNFIRKIVLWMEKENHKQPIHYMYWCTMKGLIDIYAKTNFTAEINDSLDNFLRLITCTHFQSYTIISVLYKILYNLLKVFQMVQFKKNFKALIVYHWNILEKCYKTAHTSAV